MSYYDLTTLIVLSCSFEVFFNYLLYFLPFSVMSVILFDKKKTQLHLSTMIHYQPLYRGVW